MPKIHQSLVFYIRVYIRRILHAGIAEFRYHWTGYLMTSKQWKPIKNMNKETKTWQDFSRTGGITEQKTNQLQSCSVYVLFRRPWILTRMEQIRTHHFCLYYHPRIKIGFLSNYSQTQSFKVTKIDICIPKKTFTVDNKPRNYQSLTFKLSSSL